jgi:hypothetical protein
MDNLKDLWTRFLSLKKWQKAVVYFVILMLIGSIGNLGGSGGSSDTSSSGSVQERSYPVEYLSHADINPATVSVRFGIKNDGTQPITPTCKIKMSDSSGTYSGYDFFDITDPIAAGQTKQAVVQLTITNEGSAYVDQFTGSCTAKTSDTGSSVGKEVVISNIRNCSDGDEDGWYWGACFNSDQPPMTQMDCTETAFDANGKEIGTHTYRANTVNDGVVVPYGQDVLWYVEAPKSVVQSVKSFKIKCTL